MRLLRFDLSERQELLALLTGSLMVLWGATGWSGRRAHRDLHHGAFEFARYSALDWLLVAFGGTLGAVGLAAWLRERGEQRAWDRRTADARYERATLPRSICMLMAAIARADGRLDVGEREAIEAIAVRRMHRGVLTGDVRTWLAESRDGVDAERLARHVAELLGEAERRELFAWCREVARAVGGVDEDEHAVLAAIARGLRVDGDRKLPPSFG